MSLRVKNSEKIVTLYGRNFDLERKNNNVRNSTKKSYFYELRFAPNALFLFSFFSHSYTHNLSHNFSTSIVCLVCTITQGIPSSISLTTQFNLKHSYTIEFCETAKVLCDVLKNRRFSVFHRFVNPPLTQTQAVTIRTHIK